MEKLCAIYPYREREFACGEKPAAESEKSDQYSLADIISVKFDSERMVSGISARPNTAISSEPGVVTPINTQTAARVSIPAGTRISVLTIDAIDSSKNHVGDRFQASLEQPLIIEGNVIVAKGADVYGRLAEAKESGTFTGRSQLRLELTDIVVNGQRVPIATGEYELTSGSARTLQRELRAELPLEASSALSPAGAREQQLDRRWSRFTSAHKGRTSENPERDSARFHAATGRVNTIGP